MGNVLGLSGEVRNLIVTLKISSDQDGSEECKNLSFVQRALKRQKVDQEDSVQKYMDTWFIMPTSDVCERLFSTVGQVLSDRLNRTTPANLQAQVFLYANRDLWGPEDINKLTML